eukprot:scaffold37400_cov20-Tisochrysis_lutea.AAC.1
MLCNACPAKEKVLGTKVKLINGSLVSWTATQHREQILRESMHWPLSSCSHRIQGTPVCWWPQFGTPPSSCIYYRGANALAIFPVHLQEDSGHTCVLVAVCGLVVAVIAVTDPPKPEAPAVVSALQSQLFPAGKMYGAYVRSPASKSQLKGPVLGQCGVGEVSQLDAPAEHAAKAAGNLEGWYLSQNGAVWQARR